MYKLILLFFLSIHHKSLLLNELFIKVLYAFLLSNAFKSNYAYMEFKSKNN
jgi:hypothetical protein